MAKWNLQKRNMLNQLQEDQTEFYKTTLPAMVETFQSFMRASVDIQMVSDMLNSATEIRALLKDWDRTTFNA